MKTKPKQLLEIYMFGVIIFVVAIVVIDAIALLQYYTLTSLKQKYPKFYDTPTDEYMPLIFRHTNMSMGSKQMDTSGIQGSNDVTIENYDGKYNVSSNDIQFRQKSLKSVDTTADEKMTLAAKTFSEKISEGALNINEGKTHRIALYGVQHPVLRHRILSMKMSSCYTYNNCRFFYIEGLGMEKVEADAVIFDERNIPEILPAHSNKNQVFIYTELEPPLFNHKTNLDRRRFFNYFNYTMTYRLDSTIPFPYGSVVLTSVEVDAVRKLFETKGYFESANRAVAQLTDNQDNVRKNYRHIFQQKHKQVVWFVGRCTTASKREQYVKEMRKYIDIDVVGACNSENLNICQNESKLECEYRISPIYKFYIAFEISFCNDYITEKTFRWFSRDIVLVVRGARNYDKFLPKGTYIDAEQFRSPMELALYLTELGSDEMRYTEILRRKGNYKVIDTKTHGQMSFCNLCYRLNNIAHYRNVIADMSNWRKGNTCENASDMLTSKE
ncbi:alpha-(1,3)-fucosyltransferase fut-5-like [Mercenaria mercenaria]|uniref:alpha-(1,3)-fucosyltransferase fut-5-like n=1 Tax=Mercenaria mercenaria TaxID=6596 RepID=UPI00234FA565|nr:alpha-(1,3)-fucosyltransferase fut-5-like [Mercenaria mercenaria]XP_045187653.2 alpha-(1,3)-fucosyltransferase fut-5-like [Mercenaria mercenaria]